MLESLRNWAQSMVDRAIGEVVTRAIVVIPFLIAFGFGTAALSIRLNRELGPEMGSLILAVGFAAIGLLAALVVYMRSETPATEDDDAPSETLAGDAETSGASSAMSGMDRELVMAALSSAAPLAMPSLIRMAMRNLPLIAAVAAAVFVVSRDSGSGALEPGE